MRTLPAVQGNYQDFRLLIDPQFSVYQGMDGKGYTLQAVLKDADRNLPDRAQAAAQVRAAGYDIRQETLRLQQLYTGLIAKRGAAHA